jgi:hypothetical protein
LDDERIPIGSAAFLDECERVQALLVPANLKMEVRSAGAAAVAREPNDLACGHGVVGLDQQSGQVPVHALVSLRMLDDHKTAVLGIGAGLDYRPATGRPHQGTTWYCDIDAGMGLIDGSGAYLAAGQVAGLVQWPVMGQGRAILEPDP